MAKVKITEEDIERGREAFYRSIEYSSEEEADRLKLIGLRSEGAMDEATFRRLKRKLKETYSKIGDAP